ncbi:cyclic di-GMP phosphodiesterase response regulator RpfG [bacterium BMS3Abin07]|nr:cyclic di-GMP phosphodiesterase response regulator RpfG [bacterium BMS3Abin07]GBE33330.1 cyclic di-GMP phosphodiesterase response regulator RpfG [bacterium BMS3Bbin05]HDO22233.1 HD domain-containing protein [Nitrospirota bacterium]HDZ87742.1 HD domain-containing protein [Nitrospirota bacterium]
MFSGIRFKLSVVIFLLIAAITTASSFVVTDILYHFIQDELIKRGFSIGSSVAQSAGYSMLSDDSLALDNLASKLKGSEDDILFVSVTDKEGKIVADSNLGMKGTTFNVEKGKLLRKKRDGSRVWEYKGNQKEGYVFSVPIVFADRNLGEFYIGIGTESLVAAQSVARRKIITVSLFVLLIGAVGIFFLSAFITKPIERLSEGVSKLSTGEYSGEIRVVSRDELGQLTRSFNQMAQLITDQKSNLERHARGLEDAYVATVKVLATAIDARDPRTLGHSARVARLSVLLGERAGLRYEELKDLEMACLFHDVGKIRTPDSILHKEGSLSDEETLIMMKHTVDGADILKLVESLHKHIPAVLYHHEWYNGKGYPYGLRGEEIPLFAAILSITDAYDAMTSARPYNHTRTKEQAIGELRLYKGQQFAPQLTDLFIGILRTAEDAGVRAHIEA